MGDVVDSSQRFSNERQVAPGTERHVQAYAIELTRRPGKIAVGKRLAQDDAVDFQCIEGSHYVHAGRIPGLTLNPRGKQQSAVQLILFENVAVPLVGKSGV